MWWISKTAQSCTEDACLYVHYSVALGSSRLKYKIGLDFGPFSESFLKKIRQVKNGCFTEIKMEKNWQNHSLVIYTVNYSYTLHKFSNSWKYFKSPPKQIIQKMNDICNIIFSFPAAVKTKATGGIFESSVWTDCMLSVHCMLIKLPLKPFKDNVLQRILL